MDLILPELRFFSLKTNTVYRVQVVASSHQTSACLRPISNADRPWPRDRLHMNLSVSARFSTRIVHRRVTVNVAAALFCGQHLAVKVAWRCHSHSDDARGNIFVRICSKIFLVSSASFSLTWSRCASLCHSQSHVVAATWSPVVLRASCGSIVSIHPLTFP